MKTLIALVIAYAALVSGCQEEFCGTPPPERSCGSRLGLNEFCNSDVVISASTSFNFNHGCQRSALFETGQGSVASWSAQVNDGNQWIQADFGCPRTVNGVLLQGRGVGCCAQWVTSFRMLFSNDGEVFYSTQPIDGTFDRHTVARRYFDRPITARYFRLNPITSVATQPLCIRST